MHCLKYSYLAKRECSQSQFMDRIFSMFLTSGAMVLQTSLHSTRFDIKMEACSNSSAFYRNVYWALSKLFLGIPLNSLDTYVADNFFKCQLFILLSSKRFSTGVPFPCRYLTCDQDVIFSSMVKFRSSPRTQINHWNTLRENLCFCFWSSIQISHHSK
jgi:hypothetical protein